jgi:hypothetical protein
VPNSQLYHPTSNQHLPKARPLFLNASFHDDTGHLRTDFIFAKATGVLSFAFEMLGLYLLCLAPLVSAQTYQVIMKNGTITANMTFALINGNITYSYNVGPCS